MFASTPTDTDRGVSVAITHTLVIGITAVLITGLLIGIGSILSTEIDRSAERSLETIGERLAGEVTDVNRLGVDENSSVTLTATHPSDVASKNYVVELRENCGEPPLEAPFINDSDDCVYLWTRGGEQVDVYVPLSSDVEIANESTAPGGIIDVHYDSDEDEVRIEGGR